MTATVDAVLTTFQADGGGDGKSVTTPAGMSGKRVLAFVGSSSNADTITAPASGTWAEVNSGGDKVITTSGGQLRTFEGRNLSDSTAYAFTLSGGRRSLCALVIGGEDDSGSSMVDVAASLESAAAGTHAPPSVTPTASSELVVDCLMFRQFNPDTSTCTPPATGLTWTEQADFRGADGNNNVQIAVNSATAGSSGVAISTAALNTVDTFEPAMVMRVVILSAAGGGLNTTVAATETATLTSVGTVDKAGVATLTETATLTSTGAVTKAATATVTQTASLTAVGAVTKVATAALSQTASLASIAVTSLAGAAPLTATAGLTSIGVKSLADAPTLIQTAALTAAAGIAGGGVATLSTTAGLTTAGAVTKAASTLLTTTAALTVTGSGGAVVTYRTAVLTAGAASPAALQASVRAPATLTTGAAAPATLTASTL